MYNITMGMGSAILQLLFVLYATIIAITQTTIVTYIHALKQAAKVCGSFFTTKLRWLLIVLSGSTRLYSV